MKQILVSLSAVTIALTACNGKSIEGPDRIFNLVVPLVQETAPDDWKIRLPSSVRITGYDGSVIPLYAKLEKYENSRLRIAINSQFGCQSRSCEVGSLFSEKNLSVFEDLKSQPIFSKDDLDRLKKIQEAAGSKSQADTELLMRSEGAVLERSNVDLGEGVNGTLILQNHMGVSTPAAWILIWEQDEQFYSVSFRTAQKPENRDEILNVGKSMVRGKPIMKK
jgi:hypothetical protein